MAFLRERTHHSNVLDTLLNRDGQWGAGRDATCIRDLIQVRFAEKDDQAPGAPKTTDAR